MTDELRKKKEARLDEAAKAWKAAEAIPENEAETLKLLEEVWTLAYELAEDIDLSKVEQMTSETFSQKPSKKKERDISVLPRVLEEAIHGYDPSIGSFSHYLSMLLKNRSIDAFRHNAIHNPVSDSLDREISMSSGDSVTLGDDISADTDVEGDAEDRLRLFSLIAEQTSLVLNFFHRHAGRAANETRRMWYRLFFTEDMTNVCKESPSVIQHPRDAFLAMDLAYLDHYMSRICRAPMEIRRTLPKPYCDVVPDSDDCSTTWLDLDFPGDVSLFYLLEITGSRPGRSARSNQLKFYRKELNGLL